MPDTTNMSDDELRNALIDAWDDGTRGSQYDRSGWDSVVRYVRTLIPAAAKPPERWATAMTESNGHIYASCNDGTTWELPDGRIVWDQLSSIPQPDAPPEPVRDAVGRHHGSSGRIAAPDLIRERADLLAVAKIARFRLQNYNLRADVWQETADWLTAAINREEAAAPDPLRDAAPELLAAVQDALGGWRYIRRHHGDLPGVGWDRVENALADAIDHAEGRNP